MINLLIVDDHKIVRDGLKALLLDNKEINIVDECSDGNEVMETLSEVSVDVVLMDINMPGKNGIEATKEVMEAYPNMRVIALTMHSEEGYISKILKAGAISYVMKNVGDEELIEAIKKTHEGKNYFSEEVSAVMMSRYLKKKGSGKARNSLATVDDLTEREIEVVKLISEELTNNEIAEKLYISPRTVDTHRRNLLQKLSVKNTAGLVRFAFENNLMDN